MSTLFPAGKEFPNPDVMTSPFAMSLRDSVRPEEWFKQEVESFPKREYPRFRKYVGPVGAQTYPTALQRCGFLAAARNLLRTIASMDKRENAAIKMFAYGLVGTELTIDREGRLQFDAGPLIAAVNGIEADRIRQCVMCEKIFWARRTDQKCCSTPHQKLLRTRLWRARYQERYKMSRYKKEGKR